MSGVNNTTEEHLGLLIKMLKMTTSDNDNQALVAMRKSNELLQRCGGDWDTLLRGKVKIIGNPFENMAAPTPRATVRTAPQPPSRPKPPPPPQPQTFMCIDCGNPVSTRGVRCAYCTANLNTPKPPPRPRPQYQPYQKPQPQPMSASQIKAARRSGTVKINDLA